MLTGDTLSAILDSVFVLIYLTILLIQDLSLGLLALALGLVQVVVVIGTARRAHHLLQADLVAIFGGQRQRLELAGALAEKEFAP
jgi:ATP-binding cassette, subfamily B, bacterial